MFPDQRVVVVAYKSAGFRAEINLFSYTVVIYKYFMNLTF